MGSKRSRMYDGVKTWNPLVGCEFDCRYCRHTFQKLASWQKCVDCQGYTPHEHPERLDRIPKVDADGTVFVCGSGDISFASREYMRRILAAMRDNPRPAWYLQSKRPECFAPFLDELPPETYLVTTLETERDAGYDQVSNAPLPMDRWRQFVELRWQRKVVTVEPMMAFGPTPFFCAIRALGPDHVWIGYNSTPGAAPIPEPSEEDVRDLVGKLQAAGIDVREKKLRGLQGITA